VSLLLDQHYSPEIADQLRRRGHDVIAVSERPELRGLADEAHLATAPGQRRAIVTENVGDFRPLLANAARAGTANYGLVCVSPPVSAEQEHDRPHGSGTGCPVARSSGGRRHA
jgi:hypothetical protein